MLKNVSKKLSAVLAVSVIATVLAPAPFKAMKGWGKEANNPPPSSSSERKELNTYFQIMDFAADVSACIYKSEEERWLAHQEFNNCEHPQELTSQELLEAPRELLVDCISGHGIGVFNNLRLDDFDSGSQLVLKAADNWYRTKTQDEKKHEKQDFLSKTKDACSEGAKKRQEIGGNIKGFFDAATNSLVFRAAMLNPFCSLLISKIIANGVDPSFDLNGNGFPEPIQNLMKEAAEWHQFAQQYGLFKS